MKSIITTAELVDVFIIENVDDNDTAAPDDSGGTAEAVAVKDEFKSIVNVPLGTIVAVNVPGGVEPEPEFALTVYGVGRPVTDSVNDPDPDPDVTMEKFAVFATAIDKALVEDVFVNVM